jgi:N utilization substance protein A
MADNNTDQIANLFAREVSEINAGRVEIKAIARKAGHRTKIAVSSNDPGVDALDVCVGVRGHRIKNIADNLGGERIDIVRWDESPERLIADALQPAALEQIILDWARHRAVVMVKPDQASLALGRGGWNRELASRLSGWQIEVEET